MTTPLDQVRQGLEQIWGGMAEGWRQLQARASQALTHFVPGRHGGELETAEEQVQQQASRWGLLAAEIIEGRDDITVRLEAPGMERQAFDIHMVDDHTLMIRGEKRLQRHEKHGQYHMMECAYGRFQRLLRLPAQVDEGGASASYRRGVLTVTLPKHASQRSRRIPVNAA